MKGKEIMAKERQNGSKDVVSPRHLPKKHCAYAYTKRDILDISSFSRNCCVLHTECTFDVVKNSWKIPIKPHLHISRFYSFFFSSSFVKLKMYFMTSSN